MEKDFPHLSAFVMPRTSVCCVVAQRRMQILPGESPGQGEGGCMPLRPRASLTLMATEQCLGAIPEARGSAPEEDAPGLVSH